MGIKIQQPEKKSPEQLRAEFLATKANETRRLQTVLKELCRDHRPASEESLAGRWRAELDYFLRFREPNQAAREFYESRWLRDDMDWRERSRAVQEVLSQVRWVLRLTDHPRLEGEPFDGDRYEESSRWESDERRPPFPVEAREDAPSLLRADAVKAVDGIIGDFVSKVTDKLVDILAARPGYTCVLDRGEFVAGTFVGDIRLAFPGGVSFRAHVKLITNYSACGRPYGQYPLTFHDVVAGECQPPIKFASQGEVHTLLGVEEWRPPRQQGRHGFPEARAGDIIEAAGHGVVLVTATRKGVASAFRPDAGELTVPAEDIRCVIARTRSSPRYLPPPASGCRHRLRLLLPGYKEVYVPLDDEENGTVEPLGYREQEREVRRLGFASLLRQWDSIMPPHLRGLGTDAAESLVGVGLGKASGS